MDYAMAMRHIDKGRRAKRDCWETYVHRSGTQMHFILPAALAVKLGTVYKPSEIDMRSADWSVA